MLIPLAIILFLAVLGGGILPGALPVCAVAALLSILVLRSARPSLCTRGLWWTGQLAIVWLLLTLVPLPKTLLGTRRNAHFDRVEQALTAYETQQSQTPASKSTIDFATIPVLRRLTLNQAGTLRFIYLFVGCWSMFWLVGRCSSRGRHQLIVVLVLGGAGIAAAGLLGPWLLPQERTFWWRFFLERGEPIGSFPIGPFVNRNHFASFCAMLVPAAIFLLVSPRDESQGEKRTTRRRRLPSLRTCLVKLVYLIAVGILVGATIQSLSRGGLLAMLVGVGVVVLVTLRGHPVMATATAVIAVAVLFVLVLWPSVAVQKRVQTLTGGANTSSGQARIQTWRDSVRLWRDYRLAGCGQEAFRPVFPLYKSRCGNATFTHAENDYVQLLADGGVIGVGLLLALLWGYVYATVLWRRSSHSLRTEPRDRHRYASLAVPSSLLRNAAFGAAAVVACHALVDFSLRIPLNAFLFAALLGLALPLNRDKAKTGTSAEKTEKKTRFRILRPLVVHWCVCGALLVLMVYTGLRSWKREWFYDRPTFLEHASTQELCRALTWAPTYWYAWYEMGRRASDRAAEYYQAAQTPSEERSSGVAGLSKTDLVRLSASWQKFALSCLRRSAECNQSDYEAWWELGHAELAAGNVEEAHTAFGQALRLRPNLRPKIDKLLGTETPSKM
ncbi:MAG: O-antigen ligase family protein [Lentisphaeria bacterium]|nr:O-antigen ligase family protein [Lentisphaeria bacterium]